ncbi:DNA replication factor C complex subunit Rfc1 [Stygiomarasmius scandens]|uniref:DNA replication factor C complex subunit Rfc1 n=1 Tax=Marasmiellus scandens TaxID=2682957 RepID=A0ABR1JM26_9AGAR
MSFAGTPLGQGRRLDHHTFLGKPPSNGNRPPSPHRIPPSSYAYGAPALGSRSPPKPTSPPRERNPTTLDHNDDSALARFAKLKQQQSLSHLPGAPKIITSPPHNDKWSVKDTSVLIASAFHQAASGIEMSNPNAAWASGSRSTTVPRSTSVDYEQQQSSTSTRRLAPPPPRNSSSSKPNSNARARPLPKKSSSSLRIVPDSEGEESQSMSIDRSSRALSPLDPVVDMAQRAYSKASFWVKEKSSANDSVNENGSYDYAAEESAFQNEMESASAKRSNAAVHRKNRMSMDNKAYKPTQEEVEAEEDDDDFSEGGRKRRRKAKKKEAPGGPLQSLPVVGAEKRRKKRKGKGAAGGEEEDEEVEEGPGSDGEIPMDRQSAQRATSVRRSVSRHPSVQPQDLDGSFDVEQGLQSIPEDDVLSSPENTFDDSTANLSSSSLHNDGIGAKLGTLVFTFFRLGMSLITMLFHGAGKVLGMIFDIMFFRPMRWASRVKHGHSPVGLTYLVVALIFVLAAYVFKDPIRGFHLPTWSSGPSYSVPEVPVENLAELNARLQSIEAALSSLTRDNEQSRIRTENGEKGRMELAGRLGSLEGAVRKDLINRLKDIELSVGDADKERRALGAVQKEVLVLKEVVDVLQQRPSSSDDGERVGSDAEARAKLQALEERVGSVEGGVKEALELGKNAVKTGSSPSWWNKGSNKGLTIKSSDGQDVTSLIQNLVDSAVSLYGKDILARPDFAQYSGGARVVPSLTSPTFELRPPNLRSQLVGMLTGGGYQIGRPPVTALHHDLHNGNCWPMVGTEGNLGVALATPAYIESVSIDHVPSEASFDMRSAPRHMEVWGMIEGRDNVAKFKQLLQDKEARREEARQNGEEVPPEEDYPKDLPKNYMRIASFTYNIHSPQYVQTFPILPEVKELGIDFGIVVLRIMDNWGRDEFTCLYRFRVHGQQMGEIPLPYPEEVLDSSS